MRTAAYSRQRSEDGERPFWISYADLMTALMILFLVIMVSALTAATRRVEQVLEQPKTVTVDPVRAQQRQQDIDSICEALARSAAATDAAVSVDCQLNRIGFGEVGRFERGQYRLDADGERTLLEVVPLILESANTPLGQKWLKQIVIEGHTDTDGSYLYNLNLSLRRSEWVMCTLLGASRTASTQLTPEQRQQIKQLFLAGGVSFNNARDSKDASRRVELRLQFYGLDDAPQASPDRQGRFQDNPNERCYI
jgi:outer membrane protein OmpA-like peptidoglycan-associated protein